MPLQVDNLTPQSSLKSTRDAISASIRQCMKEDTMSMKECSGMIYGIARDKTGHELKEGNS